MILEERGHKVKRHRCQLVKPLPRSSLFPMAEVAKPTPAKTSFQDKEKPTEVRLSNILAAKGKCHKCQLFSLDVPCHTYTTHDLDTLL